jgi:DNA polymerase III alpha subunit (gram-positive type)
MNTPEYTCPSCKTTCIPNEQENVDQNDLQVFECPHCHNVYIVNLDEIK